jgi:predicted glycoside hydrolase/deacetylase ChbG (UPF0249 family)
MFRACGALSVSLLVAYLTMTWGPQPSAPNDGQIRLIVQSDDMASAHGANAGTIQAYREGIVRSANVIATGPWLPEAARLLRENPGLDVGVHLALTSEWDGLRWRPLTLAPSLVDDYGYLFPTVYRKSGFPRGSSLKEAALDPLEAKKELRAQIELVRKMIPRVTYVWPHMGFSDVSPRLHSVVEELAEEYELVLPGPDIGVEIIDRVYNTTDSATERVEKLTKVLKGLAPGTWMIYDHPCTDTPELRAYGHPGYRHVAADRAATLQAWTSPVVMEVIKDRGIELTNYRHHEKWAAQSKAFRVR